MLCNPDAFKCRISNKEFRSRRWKKTPASLESYEHFVSFFIHHSLFDIRYSFPW